MGKTIVAAALILAARAAGRRVIGFKPAETGLVDGLPADSEVLAAAAGVDEPLARPLLRLREALTPALAAERAGLAFHGADVLLRLALLRARGYQVVIEGAGGLLSPLAWDLSALELAARAGLDALVVAHAGLGTLSQVLLAVEALRARGVGLRGVVLNGAGTPSTLAEETNPGVLARLLPGTRIVNLPRQASDDPHAVARLGVAALAPLA